MAILKLSDFKVAYPNLWLTINNIRIETGSQTIDNLYPERFNIPIRMSDAALAELFLTKSSKSKTLVPLGYNQFEKIKQAVISEPNVVNWLNVLYYNSEEEDTTHIYNKELKVKPKNKVKKQQSYFNKETEIILSLTVTKVNGKDIYTATDVNTGIDYTDKVNNMKMKYAIINKGVIRGREDSIGNYKWRVIKEKFVKECI